MEEVTDSETNQGKASTIEKEEKQVEGVTDSETDQGKTSNIEGEQVEREVSVSEPKFQKTPTSKENKIEQEVTAGEADAKTTHIKRLIQIQRRKLLQQTKRGLNRW